MVLPPLSGPVKLSEQHQQQHSATSASTLAMASTTTSNAVVDADKLIEELMKEAERDPALREMSGLGKMSAASSSEKNVTRFSNQQMHHRSAETSATGDRGLLHSSRKAQQTSSSANRSKSADGRPYGAASNRVSTKRAPGDGLYYPTTGEIMHEVVSDTDHHSVKDLVAMIEKNTRSESAHPYVRKWGCDLISPEPHTRNVTARFEKRQLVEEEGGQEGQRGGRRNRNSTYNWTKDDEFQRRYDISDGGGGILPSMNNNVNNNGADYQAYDDDFFDRGDFQMSSHVADMDTLLGRSSITQEDQIEVQWPPSQSEDETETGQLLQQQQPLYSSVDLESKRNKRNLATTTTGGRDFNAHQQQVEKALIEMDKHILSEFVSGSSEVSRGGTKSNRPKGARTRVFGVTIAKDNNNRIMPHAWIDLLTTGNLSNTPLTFNLSVAYAFRHCPFQVPSRRRRRFRSSSLLL